jgi:hypothetical protein
VGHGLSAAVRHAAATPPIALALGLLVVVSVLVLNFNVVVPLVARDVLGQGARGFGLLMSSLGAGAIGGGLAVALVRRRGPSPRFLAAAAAALCAGLLALSLATRIGPAAVVLVALGFAQILFTTGCNTMLQLGTPDALRGRVMGLYALAFAGMSPLGSLLVGAAAEHVGVRLACALGGAAGLLAVGLVALAAHRARIAWASPRE